MREAAAEDARHSFLDFLLRCLRILVEECFGCQDDAIQTIAALRGLFFDEGFLNGVQPVYRAQPFERDNFKILHRLHRRDAGADRLAFHEDRAGSALAETATELRAVEGEVVTQYIKQRHTEVYFHRVAPTIYFQSKNAHYKHLFAKFAPNASL